MFKSHLYVSCVSFYKRFISFALFFFFGFGIFPCNLKWSTFSCGIYCKYFSFYVISFALMGVFGVSGRRAYRTFSVFPFIALGIWILGRLLWPSLQRIHVWFFFSSNCMDLFCMFRSLIHLEFIFYSVSFPVLMLLNCFF